MNAPLKLGEPRTLGSLGDVGPLSIGCWRLTGSDSNNSSVISAAVDAGMNLVDNADVYGLDWGGTHFGACEEALGRVLATTPGLRDRIVLATKGGIIPGVPYDSSSAYLVSACEASLSRMGVDHVDLYQIHRPDHFTHPQEVASAFASLHSRGLVRDFGVSNYTATQTLALNGFVENGLVSVQPQFSAIHLDPMRDGIFDLCQEAALTPLAWSPLAGGVLATGTGVRKELIKVLDDLALREGVTRAAVAIAFVLAHPSQPVAIVGTQNANRIVELAQATTISLSRTDVYSIVQASDARPLP